jgi:hypothetical protein
MSDTNTQIAILLVITGLFDLVLSRGWILTLSPAVSRMLFFGGIAFLCLAAALLTRMIRIF